MTTVKIKPNQKTASEEEMIVLDVVADSMTALRAADEKFAHHPVRLHWTFFGSFLCAVGMAETPLSVGGVRCLLPRLDLGEGVIKRLIAGFAGVPSLRAVRLASIIVRIEFALSQEMLNEFARSGLGQAVTELTVEADEDGPPMEVPAGMSNEDVDSNICFGGVDLSGMPLLRGLTVRSQSLCAIDLTKERYPKLCNVSIDHNNDGDRDVAFFNMDLPELQSLDMEYITIDNPGGRWDQFPAGLHRGNFGFSLSRSPKLRSLSMYKCWGLGVGHRSNANTVLLPSCTDLSFHRSDDLDHLVFWAPRLRAIDLQAVFALDTVRILNTIPAALFLQLPGDGPDALSYSTNCLDLFEGSAFEAALCVESPLVGGAANAKCYSFFEQDAVPLALQLVLPFIKTQHLAECIAPCSKPALALAVDVVKSRPRRQSWFNVNVTNTKFGRDEYRADDSDVGEALPNMPGGNLFSHPRCNYVQVETGEYYPDVRFEDFAGEWLYSGEPGQYPAAGVEDEGIAASLVEDYEVKYGDESDNGSDDGEDGDY